jgi:hypothetical protein
MIELVRRDFVVDVPLQVAWNRLSLVEDWPSWAKHIKAVAPQAGRPADREIGRSFSPRRGCAVDFSDGGVRRT